MYDELVNAGLMHVACTHGSNLACSAQKILQSACCTKPPCDLDHCNKCALSTPCRCPLWSQALEKYNVEKDIAAFIKKEFDKKYNPTWHCIVGRNFGEGPDSWDAGGELCEFTWAARLHLALTSLTLCMCAGSYVTHETKHFIYFYLGEQGHGSGACMPCHSADCPAAAPAPLHVLLSMRQPLLHPLGMCRASCGAALQVRLSSAARRPQPQRTFAALRQRQLRGRLAFI